MARTAGPRGLLSRNISVKVTPEQEDELTAAALAHETTTGEVIRVALDEYLRRERPRIAPLLRGLRTVRATIGGSKRPA